MFMNHLQVLFYAKKPNSQLYLANVETYLFYGILISPLGLQAALNQKVT